MYYVSAQGIDERMTNVHYYYIYYCISCSRTALFYLASLVVFLLSMYDVSTQCIRDSNSVCQTLKELFSLLTFQSKTARVLGTGEKNTIRLIAFCLFVCSFVLFVWCFFFSFFYKAKLTSILWVASVTVWRFVQARFREFCAFSKRFSLTSRKRLWHHR